MRKWDLALITLLIVCLGVNVFIWREVKDIKDNQTGMARRDQVDSIGLSVSDAVQTLEVFAKEQKWIQENTFLLNKEESGTNTMVVNAKFTFSTMEQNQSPYFLYREKGAQDWIQLELAQKGVLNYEVELNLAPLLEYEYQLLTSGDQKRASDIRVIPYNIYGAPKWKEEIKPKTNNSGDIEFKIYVFITENWPLPGMEPKNVTLKLEANGKELKNLSLVKDNENKPDTWNVQLNITDFALIDGLEAYIKVEYLNGLQRVDDIELFKQRVEYEIEKNNTNAKILVKS
ncbi:MAG: hypothetical protein APF84_01850 [Gracilibacter sp. BRH_c7a]|nr:MAG: hypothetical protein APF84_01850 [Gracilibacter sp. BRH_c7a]